MGGKKSNNFCCKGKAYLHLSATRVLVGSPVQHKARSTGVPGFFSKGAVSERPHMCL